MDRRLPCGIPELHLKGSARYIVFKYENDNLIEIRHEYVDTKLLNNGRFSYVYDMPTGDPPRYGYEVGRAGIYEELDEDFYPQIRMYSYVIYDDYIKDWKFASPSIEIWIFDVDVNDNGVLGEKADSYFLAVDRDGSGDVNQKINKDFFDFLIGYMDAVGEVKMEWSEYKGGSIKLPSELLE